MIGGIVRFLIFRVFGARVVLVVTVLAWLRNRLWPSRRSSAPPHGSSVPPRSSSGRASSSGDRR
jgi:hypothetical protein